MSDAYKRYDIIASGSVVGATGLLAAGGGPAGAVTARTGPGVYTITLPGGGVAQAECSVQINPKGDDTTGNVQAPSVEHTSDTVKTVHLSIFNDDGNTPSDLDFMFTIVRGYKR